MSEPTGDGSQKPDPGLQAEGGRGQNETAGQAPDQGQEQASGSVFSDPTAPVWADPTAPIPAPPSPSASTQDDPPMPPAPPFGTYPPFGEQPPPPPQSPPPPPPPMSNPYAQQPPATPWQPSQPDPYGQPQPSQQYSAYGQSAYASGVQSNTSAIVLTIVSALTTLSTCVIGIPSLVLAIMALTSNSTDPQGSRKKSRTGWIVLAINAGIVIVLGVVAAILLLAFSSGSPSISDSGF